MLKDNFAALCGKTTDICGILFNFMAIYIYCRKLYNLHDTHWFFTIDNFTVCKYPAMMLFESLTNTWYLTNQFNIFYVDA